MECDASPQGAEGCEKIEQAGLEPQVKALIQVLRENPYQNPPQYEKLVGDLKGYYARRINIQHRMVYSVDEDTKTVKIQSMWAHYES